MSIQFKINTKLIDVPQFVANLKVAYQNIFEAELAQTSSQTTVT